MNSSSAALQAYAKSSGTDHDARVVQYLPLVRHVVGRMGVSLPPHLDFEDLLSAGVCGLIQATHSFDPTKGCSFKSHAFTRIRGAVLDELRRADPIPKKRRKLLKQIDAAHARLTGEHGTPPTPEELAEETGITVEELDEHLVLARRAALVSLDAPQGGEGEGAGSTLAESVLAPNIPEPSSDAQRRENLDLMVQALSALPKREREVIGLFYTEGLRQKEIADLLGVTSSRVSQIHSRALMILRREMTKLGLS
ncbi:MAG: FliA/WhiG family RNA polymerase sigma factor [Planctomycetota bacterium]